MIPRISQGAELIPHLVVPQMLLIFIFTSYKILMKSFQIKKSPKIYDVCIVGSGAGGGMAAKILTEAGAKVALLEAGPAFDARSGDMFKWPYQSPQLSALGVLKGHRDPRALLRLAV